MDALIPVLQAKLSELDTSVPVFLRCLDSACFGALTADSDLKGISKSNTDNKYHVIGELMVTPFSLLNNTLQEILRIVSVCKDHTVWVMEIVPHFLLKACCDEKTHCLNIRGIDSARKIMDDLSGLNGRTGKHLATNLAQMISTVDLLTGVPAAAASKVQMDGLYKFWSNEPVHGDKIAYSKIALGVLDILDRKLPDDDLHFNLSSRKRGRDSSLDRYSTGTSSSLNTSWSDRDSHTLPRRSRSDRDLPTLRTSSSYRTYPGGSRRTASSAARASRGVTTDRVVIA